MTDLPLSSQTTFGFHSKFPDPTSARRAVDLAHKCGFNALAVGDHLAYPLPIDDPLLQLAQVATLSDRLYVHTSVYLLPLRHPLAVAKQVATLERIAGGRLIFGVGVGGEFPNEFAAAGIPVRERGSRMDESIEVLRKLWTGAPITHTGRHFHIIDLQMLPTPVRQGGPRIWCGGRSAAALERAGRHLDGWISYVVTPDMYRDSLDVISRHYVAAQRQLDEFGSAHMLFVRLDSNWESAYKTASTLLSERYAMDFSGPTKKYVALGQPADIAEQLSAFHAAGVRYIEMDFLGSEDEKETQLRCFAEEVRPLIDFALGQRSNRRRRKKHEAHPVNPGHQQTMLEH